MADNNITESWLCVDCGINTAPGIPDGPTTRWRLEFFGSCETRYNQFTEVYRVRDKVWKRAGMKPRGGCLCIGCLEKRLGRRLNYRDFDPDDVLNRLPGTERLLDRRYNNKWKPPNGA
jgi:hypothetical protein